MRYFFLDHLCYFCLVFWYAFVRICLLMPFGHLLGKGWPFGSRLLCLIVKLSLSHWYHGFGVMLGYIDSWSLPYFILCTRAVYMEIIWFTLRFNVFVLQQISKCRTRIASLYETYVKAPPVLFLLTKAIFLLWILFIISASCLTCCLVCTLMPYSHLLGKGWPLGFLCVMFSWVFFSLSHMVSWVGCGIWFYWFPIVILLC